ncbi:MAG: polyphosphate kinase 2 family protein [Steroidobacteraceae bacterium]
MARRAKPPRQPGGDQLVAKLRIAPQSRVRLLDAHASRSFRWSKGKAEECLARNLERLEELQYRMYADGRFGMLVVFQAVDGGGKDGTIRKVFTAFNPQGCRVTAFKAPSSEELRHDYLWRIHAAVPGRGEIGVFNRSHYEDVLVVRVNDLVPKTVWSKRYAQINAFEQMLHESGIRVVKILLQISKAEQKQRFLGRLRDPRKHWKFDAADLDKRRQWNAYRLAFEAMLGKCSTACAPWYVVPADRKWFRNLAVSEILRHELESLDLRWPKASMDLSRIHIT